MNQTTLKIVVLLERIFQWNVFLWRACLNQQLPSNCFAAPHQLREPCCFTPKKQITSIVHQGVPIVSHESQSTLELVTSNCTKQDQTNWATSMWIPVFVLCFTYMMQNGISDKGTHLHSASSLPHSLVIDVIFTGIWRSFQLLWKPTQPTVRTSPKWTPIHPPRINSSFSTTSSIKRISSNRSFSSNSSSGSSAPIVSGKSQLLHHV